MALTDNLVSMWEFESASFLSDSHGTNHLTNISSVTSDYARIGRAASFAMGTQALMRASNSSLQIGSNDAEFSFWFKQTTRPGSLAVLGKHNGGGAVEYVAYVDASSGNLQFAVSNDGTNTTFLTSFFVDDNTWYFVNCWHKNGVEIGIRVNDSVTYTTPHTTGVFNGSADFDIGAIQAGISFNGLIDQVCYWKGRILTAAERTALYNKGVSISHADMVGPVTLASGLVAFWELNESSGTRSDAHGTNPLTDNNTVGSTTGKIGQCALFASDQFEFLSHVSNANLQVGRHDFTFAFWFKYNSNGVLIGKDSDSPPLSREYTIDMSSGLMRFYLNGGGTAFIIASSTLFVDVWYFAIVWHDATVNTLNIQINDDPGDLSSASSGSITPDLSNAEFRIGARVYSGFEGYFPGSMDQVGFWKRKLTTAEQLRLYNGGLGLSYADMIAGVVVATGRTQSFIFGA